MRFLLSIFNRDKFWFVRTHSVSYDGQPKVFHQSYERTFAQHTFLVYTVESYERYNPTTTKSASYYDKIDSFIAFLQGQASASYVNPELYGRKRIFIFSVIFRTKVIEHLLPSNAYFLLDQIVDYAKEEILKEKYLPRDVCDNDGCIGLHHTVRLVNNCRKELESKFLQPNTTVIFKPVYPGLNLDHVFFYSHYWPLMFDLKKTVYLQHLTLIETMDQNLTCHKYYKKYVENNLIGKENYNKFYI